jgi:hypothetical protein
MALPNGLKSPDLDGDENNAGASNGHTESLQDHQRRGRVDTDVVAPNAVNTDVVAPNAVNTDVVDPNAINTNGVNTNGVNTNGVNTNGVNTNGVNTNGINTNGVNTNFTATDIELLRLEALRLELFRVMGPPPARTEMGFGYFFETHFASVSSSPIGSPGPTVANSLAGSESEISMLDIGPSLQPANLLSRADIPNSTLAALHHHVGLASTARPGFVLGPDSDSDGLSEHRLRTEDLESVAVTSVSGSVDNDFHLSQRQRRQNETHLVLPTDRELRQSAATRESPAPEQHGHGYGYGFSSRPSSPEYFADEASRRVYSLSVPHSPRSTSPVSRPARFRSLSSFGGMDPAFVAMQVADQAQENAQNAANSERADQPQDMESSN